MQPIRCELRKRNLRAISIYVNSVINKYQRWYNELIERARNRVIDGYVETHHIIPKSLGGTNDESNLVRLTAREHLIAHMLLTKMYTCQERYKMLNAAMILATYEGNKINSRVYHAIRIAFAQEQSKARKGKRPKASGWNKGLKMPKEYCDKLSELRKGRKLSPEHVAKIRITKTGKPNLCKGRSRPSMKGKPWTEKRRAAQKARREKEKASPLLS